MRNQPVNSAMNPFIRFAFVCVLLAGGAGAAHAGTQIVGTRVIYPAEERDVSVRVLNTGNSARLLQVWADSGDDKETAETSKAPFLVTPPISRVEPGKGQALRVMFTGSADVPQDRESVYWLNVVEVPPRPTEEANTLQFAVRTRIKIFYRPKGLKGSPVDSASQVSWRLVQKEGKPALECTNNTAFNVSFADVQQKGTPPKPSDFSGGGLCPAQGRETFAIRGGGDASRLTYRAIDDFGAILEGEASYTR